MPISRSHFICRTHTLQSLEANQVTIIKWVYLHKCGRGMTGHTGDLINHARQDAAQIYCMYVYLVFLLYFIKEQSEATFCASISFSSWYLRVHSLRLSLVTIFPRRMRAVEFQCTVYKKFLLLSCLQYICRVSANFWPNWNKPKKILNPPKSHPEREALFYTFS